MLTRLKCHHCGHENPSRAKKCRGCGLSLEIVHASGLTESQVALIKKSLNEKFELLEEVGYGGMSVVYKAIQRNLDRVVALKVILPHLLDDNDTVERFHLEARTAGSLNHPNIITIYDEGQLKGVHFMSMEFIEGEDLFKIIKREGQLPIKLFQGLFVALTSALQYLESRELVHRDIKSSNILITHSGRPVLMDFGIASIKNKGILVQNGSLMGTPEYMSPEQATGGIIDERSDLYSLGVVMFECLTGNVPFKGETYSDTIRKITYDIPPRPQSPKFKIPGKIEQIVLKLLEKDPNKRYQSALELLTAFQPQTKTNSKRRDTVLISLIAVLFIVVVSSGIFLFLSGSEKENTYPIEDKPLILIQDTKSGDTPNTETKPEVAIPIVTTDTAITIPAVQKRWKTSGKSSGRNPFDKAMNEGHYYLKNNDPEKAREAYSKASSIDPESQSAKDYLNEAEDRIKNK